MKRRLASGGVKVDDVEQARLWRGDGVVDAIEERIKVWHLEEVLILVDERERSTDHGERIAEGDEADAAFGIGRGPLGE